MIETIDVKINGKTYKYSKGISVAEVLTEHTQDFKYPIIISRINNRLRELSATIEEVVELLAVLEVGTVLEVLSPQEINPSADKARILKSLIDFLFIFYNLSLNNARHISQSLCAIAFLLNDYVYQSK